MTVSTSNLYIIFSLYWQLKFFYQYYRPYIQNTVCTDIEVTPVPRTEAKTILELFVGFDITYLSYVNNNSPC